MTCTAGSASRLSATQQKQLLIVTHHGMLRRIQVKKEMTMRHDCTLEMVSQQLIKHAAMRPLQPVILLIYSSFHCHYMVTCVIGNAHVLMKTKFHITNAACQQVTHVPGLDVRYFDRAVIGKKH